MRGKRKPLHKRQLITEHICFLAYSCSFYRPHTCQNFAHRTDSHHVPSAEKTAPILLCFPSSAFSSNKFSIFPLTNPLFLIKIICIRRICARETRVDRDVLYAMGDENWQIILRSAEPFPTRIVDRRTVRRGSRVKSALDRLGRSRNRSHRNAKSVQRSWRGLHQLETRTHATDVRCHQWRGPGCCNDKKERNHDQSQDRNT